MVGPVVGSNKVARCLYALTLMNMQNIASGDSGSMNLRVITLGHAQSAVVTMILQRMQQKRGKRVSGEGLPGGKTVKVDDMRERGHTSSVQQERSFADVVSQRKARKARVFMGDSIIRKVDKIVNRGDDITVCLPGAKAEDIVEKAGQVMGGGTGGAVLLHVGTNNADKEGASAIIGKYRRLIKTLKEARVGQIVLSGILPIMGGRGEEYRNC